MFTKTLLTVPALCVAASAQISFQPATSVPLQGLRPDWVAAGDFDGDGDRDLAVSTGQLSGGGGPDFVEILVNNGSGAFSAGQAIVIGNNVSTAALVAANLDGDGDLDLAVSLHDTGAVQVLINNGGTFALGSSVATGGSEPRHMVGGDVDNDGDVDLVTSNRASSNLRVLVNNGSGVFAQGALIATGVEPRHVALADLNGDTRRDLAVAVHDSRRVEVFLNTGGAGGTFGAAQLVPTLFSEKPSGITAADLDGDGDLDLATTIENNNAGQVIVLANSGAAAFAQTAFATNGLNPDAIVAADLDVDGDLDLATADEDSNLVSALRNNGNLQFAAGVTFAVGLHPTSLVAADLDGNGSADIATANRDSNNVSVLRNNAAGSTPATYCTAGTSANGCAGSISANANPRVNHSTPCQISVANVDGQRTAIVFYGVTQLIQPWCSLGGGTSFLCVKPPTQRGVVQSTGGTTGQCNGTIGLDWNAFQLANPGALGNPWTAGETAYVQGWFRDPTACKTTQLSNALVLTYQP